MGAGSRHRAALLIEELTVIDRGANGDR
jgi:hypothetical protein